MSAVTVEAVRCAFCNKELDRDDFVAIRDRTKNAMVAAAEKHLNTANKVLVARACVASACLSKAEEAERKAWVALSAVGHCFAHPTSPRRRRTASA